MCPRAELQAVELAIQSIPPNQYTFVPALKNCELRRHTEGLKNKLLQSRYRLCSIFVQSINHRHLSAYRLYCAVSLHDILCPYIL